VFVRVSSPRSVTLHKVGLLASNDETQLVSQLLGQASLYCAVGSSEVLHWFLMCNLSYSGRSEASDRV
jgi:hypothetical protein